MKIKAVKKITSVIIAFAALAICFTRADFAPARANAAANYGSETMKTYARMVASEVNRERSAAGLSPLRFADSLNGVALVRAQECATEFSHTRPDGTPWYTALDEAGVPYYTAGENFACGQSTPAEVMTAWMNSQEHKANILAAKYEYIGIGVWYANGQYYWTQFFTGGQPISGEIVPYISAQPQSIKIPASCNAEFSVKAEGTGLSYQWYFKKKGSDSWCVWNNHTASVTRAVSNDSWNGMQVRCRVTDSTGMIMTSAPAVITIVDGPVITSQPKNVTVAPGEVATFEITASGRDLNYQWYFRKAGVSGWSRWNSHTSAATTGTANDSWNGMQVFCRVTDAGGVSVDSDPATVTLRQAIAILSHPKDITTSAGMDVQFEVKASGKDLTYQWYYKKADAQSWALWRKHTGSVAYVTANETWDGMRVYCRVTDSTGAFVNSDSATVRIVPRISILRQPENVTAKPGRSVSVSVIASGSGLTYQWYYKKSGDSNWTVWSKHNQSTVTGIANDSWNGMLIRCRITDSLGFIVYSQAAQITFPGEITVTQGPENVIARAGDSVKFTAAAEGEGLSCQWYYKKKGAASWSVWNGHTGFSTTANSNGTWDGMRVFCLFTDKYGNTASSGIATIYILTDQ